MQIILSDYGHNDFLWADSAHLQLYPLILDWLKKNNKNSKSTYTSKL